MFDRLHEMTSLHELRVLVVAPTGSDGLLICNLLASNAIACANYQTAEIARNELNDETGAVILAEEALTLPDIARWAEKMAEQPSWSDFPIILLTVAGAVDKQSQRNLAFRKPLGNLILVERPSRQETLISTVQAALRSRRRQYQTRDFLAERRVIEETLRRSEKLAVQAALPQASHMK
jgi:FixJ family two-component response regulator